MVGAGRQIRHHGHHPAAVGLDGGDLALGGRLGLQGSLGGPCWLLLLLLMLLLLLLLMLLLLLLMLLLLLLLMLLLLWLLLVCANRPSSPMRSDSLAIRSAPRVKGPHPCGHTRY